MARSIDLLPAIVEAAGQGAVKGAPGPEFDRSRRRGSTTIVPFTPAVGRTVRQMNAATEAIADGLGAHMVTVDELGRGRGAMVVMWEDPWPEVIRWHWPADPWDGFTIATTTDGRPITTRPVGTHWLLGGATRSGKTSMLHGLIAGSMTARGGHIVVGIDPKGNEFNGYGPRMSAIARGMNLADAVQLLRAVCAHARRTAELMGEYGIDELHRPDPERGLHTVFVAIDELKVIVQDQEYGPECLRLIDELTFLRTSAGVSVAAAIQRPMANEVGPIRENMLNRACFKVKSQDQTRVILGHQDVDPRHLPARKGLAYLDIEGDDDVGCPLVKAHYLSREDRAALAQATASARPDVELGGEVERAGAANPVVLPEPEPKRRARGKRPPRRKAPEGCPVADASGMAYAHRLRAWQERGDAPSCDVCATPVEWSAAKVDPDMTEEVRVVCETCDKVARAAA